MLQCSAESWIGLQARSDKTNTSLVVKLKHQLEFENVLSGNDSVLKKQKLDGASAYGKLEPTWLPRPKPKYISSKLLGICLSHTQISFFILELFVIKI